MLCEVSVLEHHDAAVLLWDCSHYYDSLRLARTFRFAASTGYDQRLLALSVLVHAGPRLFSACGYVANTWLKDVESVVAGDGQAVTWSRMTLYDALEKLALGEAHMLSITFTEGSEAVVGEDGAEVAPAQEPSCAVSNTLSYSKAASYILLLNKQHRKALKLP